MSTTDQGDAQAGIVPGAANPLAAGWLPQPPGRQEASPPPFPPSRPSPGRAAKLPAASQAYCSAVTRNGCSSSGGGEAGARKGEGWASWEQSPQTQPLPHGVGLRAREPSWSTNSAHPQPSFLFHRSSQGEIAGGSAHTVGCIGARGQAASSKRFMVTYLPAECLETVPGGPALLRWCCSKSIPAACSRESGFPGPGEGPWVAIVTPHIHRHLHCWILMTILEGTGRAGLEKLKYREGPSLLSEIRGQGGCSPQLWTPALTPPAQRVSKLGTSFLLNLERL